VMDFTRLAGTATTPLAMIVLGGLLAEVRWSRDFELRAIGVIVAVKLFMLPAMTALCIRYCRAIDPIFTFVLMLEAAVPPATNVSLAAKKFGGNTSFVALALFLTYLLSILTIPMWLSALRWLPQ
jgi:predicted permease